MTMRFSTDAAAGTAVSKAARMRRRAALATAAAAAVWVGVGGPSAARADVTGFGGFAAVNGSASGSISTDGTLFKLTDGQNGEQVSAFTSTQQLVTSFDANFTVQATGTADGFAFIVQNQGTTALGGGGGSGGYQGITNSAAVQAEYFFQTQANGNPAAAGVSTGGAAPGYFYTGATNLVGGNPIRASVSYYNNTINYTFVDSVAHTAYSRRVTGINLPGAVGGNTAYVGFSGATGGLAATTNISSFALVSAPTFSPVALAPSSFTQDVVVEKGASQTGAASAISATMDSGTSSLTTNTWYEQGYNTAAPLTGLPASGSTFTAAGDAGHTFTLQSYAGNNVLLLGNAAGAGGANVATGTLTLTTPKAYRSLSLLAASGGGDQPLQLTINYANGTTSSVLTEVDGPDWFGGGTEAYNASGRVAAGTTGVNTFNNVNSANPNLWAVDVILPDTVDPIASVTVTDTNPAATGRTAIFGLSGAVVVAQGSLTYTGTGTPAASFDTNGSLNFQTNGTPTAFATGNSVTFDDTATGSTTVTVQAAGVSPQLVTFANSSKNYAFNGGPISALGGSFNGSGSVTFNDAVTFTGATSVNAGTVVVGTTGSFNTSAITIASGAAVTVATGGLIVGTPPVTNAGTLTLNNPARTIGSYTGAGTTVLNGTAFVVGAGTNYTGAFAGTGGSFNLTGGTYTPPSGAATAALTGGIIVGPTVGVPATLTIQDSSGSYGQTSSGAPITLTLGPAGTLTGPASNEIAWGGNVVLAAAGGLANISSGAFGIVDVNQVITGVGPVLLGAGTSSTTNLNAASTYTGETRVGTTSGGVQLQGSSVVLHVTNGASANAGLNFVNTNGSGFTFDTNGFNQTVTYLSGATSLQTVALTNSGPQATLTVNGGNVNGGPASFGVPITGNLNLLKTGAGNQLVAAANTYNGFTNVSAGTLTAANPTAFNTGPVTLTGGRLGLSGITSINAASLSTFANFQTNQGFGTGTAGAGTTVYTQNVPFISADNSTLFITSNNGNEGNSAFLRTPVTVPAAGFFATFIYQNDQGADGVAFVLQNDPRGAAAVGFSGGSLGYGNQGGGTAISPSGAVQINIFGNGGTGFGTNGTISDSQTIGNFNLGNAVNPIAVTLVYNAQAQTLTETLTDTVNTGTTGTVVFGNVNFNSILGGNTAYLGFTGGTGGAVSAQTVSNFSFGSVGNGPVSIANAVLTTANQSNGIELNVTNGFTSASIGSLAVVAGAKVSIDSVVSGTVNRGVLTIPTLTVAGTAAAPTGLIDVQNNDLVLPGASLATITAYARAGYANGTFNGSGGITSSNASTNALHVTTVGVIANNDGNGNALFGAGTAAGLFDGANANLNDVLVKYTYYGDANLDGKVDGRDYVRLDAGFVSQQTATKLTGWYNGDFNYDGKIDGSDYTLIDNAFNLQTTVRVNPSIVATSTAELAGGTAAVPEPASVGLMAVGGLVMAGRRRRRV